MKRIKQALCILILGVFCLTGCSGANGNMTTDEVLNLIEQTEKSYVNVGLFIDSKKEEIYNALRTHDYSVIKEYSSDKAIKELEGWTASNFVIIKQYYMTAIGHGNVTYFMLIRTEEGLKTLNLYWSAEELYDVEIGGVIFA